MSQKLAPIHPGQVLKRSFLEDMGISEYRLAKEIGVSRSHLSHRAGSTRHQCGHSPAIGTVFWPQRWVLDAHAGRLRPRGGTRSYRGSAGSHQPVAGSLSGSIG